MGASFILAARQLRQTLQVAIRDERDDKAKHELVCADHYIGMAQHRAASGRFKMAASAMESAAACIQFGLMFRRLRSRPV